MSRRIRWVIGLLLAGALVASAVLVVLGSVNRRQSDDPRSNIPSGAGALGQLLRDEGVEIRTTDEVEEAVTALGSNTTLVVANGNRLDEASAQRLLAGGAARVILLRPNTLALRHFGVRATAEAPQYGTLIPSARSRPPAVPGPSGWRTCGPLPGGRPGRLRLLSD